MQPRRYASLMVRLMDHRAHIEHAVCDRHPPTFGGGQEKARNSLATIPGRYVCTTEENHVLRIEDDCN